MLTPMIIKKTQNGERAMDVFSLLLEDRIVVIDGEINDAMSGQIVAQLLYLDSVNDKPITLQISSPGGSILAGLAISDTMKRIKSPVNTICISACCSMGAFLLSQGDKRYITENAFVMIHQASTANQYQNIQDLKVSFEFTERLNDLLAEMIAKACNKTKNQYLKDTARDKWMDAKESIEYGIVDEMIKPTKK